MFDFAFSEMLVVFVVALVVLGPTRLPGLVRKVGRWVGKARSMARDFREQLENEVNIEELNRAARGQAKREPQPFEHPTVEPATETVPGTPDAMAGSGYPYGTVTDTSATSADPAVTGDGTPQADDTFSHAHAEGEAPQPWSPEAGEPADPALADRHATPDAAGLTDGDKRTA